jgi:hypothetical protein
MYHPKLENARKRIWGRLDKYGKKQNRPTSVGQLLWKSKWEKPLADWIMATGVCLAMSFAITRWNEWRKMIGWRCAAISLNSTV